MAESEGSHTGMMSNSDSPRTSFPPIEEAIVVISIAMAAVAPCSALSDLCCQIPGPRRTLPTTNEAQNPKARPV